MSFFFKVLSAAYIVGIFLFADSRMVQDVATFNPYSLLHIPLYGILTILLFFSNWSSLLISRGNSTDSSNSSNPSNSSNYFVAGIIALVVAIADEIYQAYLPNRNASIVDVFLDIVGIILCVLIIRRIEHASGFSKIGTFLHRTR
jgi:hypothetical protein